MLIPFGVLSAAGVSEGGETYELIESVILTGTQASVTFSSLATYASTYKHLQIRSVAKGTDYNDNIFLQFNGNTGNNYSHHRLLGDGSSVSSVATTTTSDLIGGFYSSSATNIFAPSITDILDPFSTTKNTTIRCLHGDSNAPTIRLASGAYYNTEAISSITLFAKVLSFVAGSRFSLYGIKG
jgi:hypothetical protein